MATENENPFDILTNGLRQMRESNLPEYQKAYHEKNLRATMQVIDHLVKGDKAHNEAQLMNRANNFDEYIQNMLKFTGEYLAAKNLMVGNYLRDNRQTIRVMIELDIEDYDASPEISKSLRKLGITRNRFLDWLTLASSPDDKFEAWLTEFITEHTNRDIEITRSRILDYAMPRKRHKRLDPSEGPTYFQNA